MADDGLDDLEKDAQGRRRKGRESPGSRNPGRAEQERRQRAAERERRERERREREQGEPKPPPPPADPAPEEQPAEEKSETSPPAKRRRPASIPFYPDRDNEDFLWAIRREAVEQQENIPATAVVRLALRRLADQMSPARVVQELGGPVQSNGKMGRPRR